MFEDLAKKLKNSWKNLTQYQRIVTYLCVGLLVSITLPLLAIYNLPVGVEVKKEVFFVLLVISGYYIASITGYNNDYTFAEASKKLARDKNIELDVAYRKEILSWLIHWTFIPVIFAFSLGFAGWYIVGIFIYPAWLLVKGCYAAASANIKETLKNIEKSTKK